MKADPPSVWDGSYSARYEDANYGDGLAGYVMRKSHALVERTFGPDAAFPVTLEVGAGSGVHLRYVRHDFMRYVVTDTSVEFLEALNLEAHAGRPVTVERQDATKLSLADDSVDRLIAAHVLEHLYRPHEVLREWARVVRPGGVMSLVLPCDPGLLWRLGRHFGPRGRALSNGLAYDYVMAREHVNPINNLVAFIRYYFDDVSETWWPARLPFSDLNLIYTANIRIAKP